MKKHLKGIIIGTLVCTLLFSFTVFAANNSKMIEAFYTGIKLYVDGVEYIPTDANGNVVEPFIYNGTTYLPVRAVANAVGKDVVWDGKTQSVYLGKKDQNQPDAYLDELQFSDFRKGNQRCWLQTINGNVIDYKDNVYTSGLLFGVHAGDWCEVDYALNSQYKTLCGTIVLPKSYPGENNPRVGETSVYIYDADTNTELFKINGVNTSTQYKFEVDVQGVNKIKIHVVAKSYIFDTDIVALTGLALYK